MSAPAKQKKVKMYPVLPFTPRTERFKWDSKGTTVTNVPIKGYESIHWRDTWSTGNVVQAHTDSYLSISGVSALRSTVGDKDWRQLVATGQNATHPYARTGAFAKSTHHSGTAYSVGYSPADTVVFWGQMIGPACVQINDTTPLVDAALGRLKHKLNGYIGNAQLAAPLAEAREIHRLVRDINSFGLDAVKAMLLLKKTKGKSALKLASKIWLGFGFGINPMLKDIESAANAILDYQERADRGIRVSGTATTDYFSKGQQYPSSELSPATTNSYVLGSAKHQLGVRIVAGLDLKLRSSASYSVVDHLGLAITDFPSAIWELVPYSWAVDYFSTVSGWLDDVFFTLPGSTKYVSQSTRYQNEVVWYPQVKVDPAKGYQGQTSVTNGGFRYYSFNRISLAQLPVRSLRVKSADEIAMHGLTKFLNLAAVLSGHVKTPTV